MNVKGPVSHKVWRKWAVDTGQSSLLGSYGRPPPLPRTAHQPEGKRQSAEDKQMSCSPCSSSVLKISDTKWRLLFQNIVQLYQRRVIKVIWKIGLENSLCSRNCTSGNLFYKYTCSYVKGMYMVMCNIINSSKALESNSVPIRGVKVCHHSGILYS